MSHLNRLSKEDYKKQKELEELRKAGAAMPATDEDGRMINPHIPHYISNAPWFYEASGPTLKHQNSKSFNDRKQKGETSYVSREYKRRKAVGMEFREGACENCGSMAHKKRDCLDKPRLKTAKMLNTTFTDDIMVINKDMDFASKRDRWNNYDVREHSKVYEFHAKADAAREKERARIAKEKSDEREAKLLAKLENGEGLSDIDTDDEEEGVDNPLSDMTGGSTTNFSRGLRDRNDVAKYLLNLDPNSAYYDPKTRSMRDNPFAPDDPRAKKYAGDSELRRGGYSEEIAAIQKFAWEMNKKESSDNMIANPTAVEAQYKEFQRKRAEAKKLREEAVDKKYGGGQGLRIVGDFEDSTNNQEENSENSNIEGNQENKTKHKQTNNEQKKTEEYGEIQAFGDVLKSASTDRKVNISTSKAKVSVLVNTVPSNPSTTNTIAPSSIYLENQYELNHSQIWGSYYDLNQGIWGYGCCKGLVRTEICNAPTTSNKRKRDENES